MSMDCETSAPTASERIERHEVVCPTIGPVSVFVQGIRSPNEVVLFTVHDLGCDHSMYFDFINHANMKRIQDRTLWVHVDVPGQTRDAPDMPADYVFPTMQMIGEDLVHVLNQLKIKDVVCFGEGAGANIIARFAMTNIERVLGIVLLHCTGTAAGFLEAIQDKFINWNAGVSPSAESYLVLHRFGSRVSDFSKLKDDESLKTAVENYQSVLKTQINPKNLKKFVEAFIKRKSIAENIKRLMCPVLFMTAQKSVFNRTTHALHEALLKQCSDKGKVEFIEVSGVANLLEEKPEKVAESLQYFLQGLGLISSIPMHNIVKQPLRTRSMSMEEADMPKLRGRSLSGGSNAENSDSPKSPNSPSSPSHVATIPETAMETQMDAVAMATNVATLEALESAPTVQAVAT